MMAGFMSYFGGRRDTKQSTRDAIVTLRQQLQMIEKKEEHIQKKIEVEINTARANAISNKTCTFYIYPFPCAYYYGRGSLTVCGVSGNCGFEA